MGNSIIKHTLKTALISSYKQTLNSLIKQIYQKHPSGGELHVILDDLNVEDHFLKSTLHDIVNSNMKYEACEDYLLYTHCLAFLMELTEKDRLETIQKAYNEIDWSTVNFDD